MTTLVWFRRDLRVHDNPALNAAAAAGQPVVALYVHAPEEEGHWAPGAASRWWSHHSLAALERELSARGARLVFRCGPSLATLLEVARESGATAVHWNRLYEPVLVARDKQVKQGLKDAGLEATSHGGALLHEPWKLKTQAGDPFRVFTPFWNAFQKQVMPGAPLPPPRRLAAPTTALSGLRLDALGLLPSIPWDAGLAASWTPGEAAALARLEAFARDTVGGYKDQRDLPAVDGVSRLSPHLHFGELSPRQAWAAVARRIADARASRGAEAYLRELGWREFAHHVLFHFPTTPDAPLHAKYARFPWRPRHQPLLRAWQQGRTGYPIVDAGLRELWHTGWMHNRVRMIVASLLVKNLRVPWLEGARWFWDTLVDADLANNTMGWQWTAGCGADAAPYFRIFNPVLQGLKFDPEAAYVKKWVPELAALPAEWAHQPWRAPRKVLDATGFRSGIDYPSPLIDLATSRDEALEALQRIGK
jgi:deoxyribodipyrimidine photo-lyase